MPKDNEQEQATAVEAVEDLEVEATQAEAVAGGFQDVDE